VEQLQLKVGLEVDATPRFDALRERQYWVQGRRFKRGPFFGAVSSGKADAFALGSKNRLLENRLLLNSEFFYWDYRDHQVATIAAVTRRRPSATSEPTFQSLNFTVRTSILRRS